MEMVDTLPVQSPAAKRFKAADTPAAKILKPADIYSLYGVAAGTERVVAEPVFHSPPEQVVLSSQEVVQTPRSAPKYRLSTKTPDLLRGDVNPEVVFGWPH